MTARPSASAIARFWSHVDKSGPIPTEQPELGPCWVWTASTRPRRDGRPGYGQFRLDGKEVYAHRFAWLIEDGVWPSPCALHRCDNMRCVRISHMFIGTYKDNSADMDAKGRRVNGARIGTEHHSARLTEDDVRTIRSLRASGKKLIDLAELFNVTTGHVSNIVDRRVWKHVR